MEELTENDYEILDACCELQSMKIKALKEENAQLQAYKDINEDFKKAWEELKAENDRQKRENEIITGMCNSASNRFDKLYQTLQEIKTIAEKLMADNLCNNCDGIGLDANCQDTGCPYYQMDKILQKITKAEEE